MCRYLWKLAACALCVTHISYVRGSDETVFSDHVVKSMRGERNARDLALLYQRAIVEASNPECLRLKQSDNQSISARSAWELTLRESKSQEDKNRHGEKLPDSKVSRFIGFCEGRMNEDIPIWWHDRLCSAWVIDGQKHLLRFGGDREAIEKSVVEGNIHRIIEIKMDEKERQGTVMTRDLQFNIPLDIMRNRLLDTRATRVSGSNYGKLCVIAMHVDFGSPYEIVCFNRDVGKEEWRAAVWSEFFPFFVTSREGPFHVLDIVVTEKHVTVFGTTSFAMYIESFDVTNGSCVFRFCTSY